MNKHSRSSLDALLVDVRACRACVPHLPLGPRPIVRAGVDARILIVGQAPGARVHASGIPWDDASGDRLRNWLGIDATTFHDESQFAIIPMGFCYPGRGNGGDKPPRRECAQLWLDSLLEKLPKIQLTLLIGQYAHSIFSAADARRRSLKQSGRGRNTRRPSFRCRTRPRATSRGSSGTRGSKAKSFPCCARGLNCSSRKHLIADL